MLVIREGQEPVHIRTGDNPFELSAMTFCLVWGSISLVALSRVSGSSARVIPQWGLYLFFAVLAATSALTLTGVAWMRFRRRLSGLEMERAGLIGMFGLLIAYSIWTWAAAGDRALGFAAFMAIVWVGAVIRSVFITVDLKKVNGGRPS